jgi:hypothetical protein
VTLSSFEKRCQLLPSLFKRTRFRALGDQLEARRLIEDKYLVADVHVEWRGSPVAKPANFTKALTLDDASKGAALPKESDLFDEWLSARGLNTPRSASARLTPRSIHYVSFFGLIERARECRARG